ncbi:MAG: hypothetical protein AAFW46_11855 [Pseudomonadota bacterium]
MRSAVLSAVVLSFGLSACAAVDEVYQLENFRVVDREPAGSERGALAGVSVDAKQRLIYAPSIPVRELSDEPGADGSTDFRVRRRQVLCAEPSPDALSALASELVATARAQQGAGEGEVGGAASFAVSRSVNETVQQLGQRTQTIQLLRDSLFRACEAYANGVLDEFGYAVILGGYERFTMQALGIDALGRTGGGGQAAVTAAEREVDNINANIAAVDGAIASLDGDIAQLDEANPERTSLSALRARLSARREGLVAQRERAERDAIRQQAEALASGRPVSEQAANGVVQLAALPAGGVAAEDAVPFAPVVAGCMMWFAKNPQISVDNMAGAGPPNRRPAIASYCDLMIRGAVARGQVRSGAPVGPPVNVLPQ